MYGDHFSEHGFRDGEDDNPFTFDGPSPFQISKYPPEMVNKLHEASDLDVSPFSHHHSLGVRHNQASPGDHTHNGGSSKVLFHTFSGSGTTETNGHLSINTQAPFNTVSVAFIQYDQTLRSGGPMCTAIWYDLWTASNHIIGSQWYNGTTPINAGVVYYTGIVFP